MSTCSGVWNRYEWNRLNNDNVEECTYGKGSAISREVNKGPLTYGPTGDEKWSRTTIHQEVMVPCVLRNGSNTHPNINTHPPIYRPVDLSRSLSTSTVDPPTGDTVDIGIDHQFTYKKLRSIVDRRLNIEIILSKSTFFNSMFSPVSVYSFFFVPIFFLVWNPQTSAPITSGTHTDGGAVIGKPGSAWLEGTPAISIFFMFCFMIGVFKERFAYME